MRGSYRKEPQLGKICLHPLPAYTGQLRQLGQDPSLLIAYYSGCVHEALEANPLDVYTYTYTIKIQGSPVS